MRREVTEEITLDEVIPLVNRLSEIEREELRQFLTSKTKIDWQKEWEKVISYFHKLFEKYSEEEVVNDFEKALDEVRSDRANKSN